MDERGTKRAACIESFAFYAITMITIHGPGTARVHTLQMQILIDLGRKR